MYILRTIRYLLLALGITLLLLNAIRYYFIAVNIVYAEVFVLLFFAIYYFFWQIFIKK
jgi:hypothetical protein